MMKVKPEGIQNTPREKEGWNQTKMQTERNTTAEMLQSNQINLYRVTYLQMVKGKLSQCWIKRYATKT